MFRSVPRYVAAQGRRRPAARPAVGPPAPLRLVTRDAPEAGPARAGPGCGRGCPASAAPTSARSPGTTVALLLGRWSRCRSCPATRWSASCSTTARTCRPAPAWSSTRCWPAPPAGVEPCDELRRRARPTAATGSPSGHLSPGLQTGFCAGHRRRLGRAARRPPLASCTPCRTRSRRAGRAGRAARLRRALARCAPVSAGRPGAGRRRRRGRAVRHAGAARAHRRPARSPWSPSTATSASWPPSFGATEVVAPREVLRAAYAGPPARCQLDARARRARTCSAASTSRSTRSARAVARHRAAGHPGRRPGRAVRACRRAAPTCPPRGSASSRWSAPTPRPATSRWPPIDLAGRAPSTSRPSSSAATPSPAGSPLARAALDHALARGPRPRPLGRAARHRQGRLRPHRKEQHDEPPRFRPGGRRPHPAAARPRGRGLPAGDASRSAPASIYPPESLPAIRDVDEAIRDALLHPLGSDPLPELLLPGHAADHRVRRHLAAAAARCGRPTSAQRIIEQVLDHGRRGRRRRRRADRRPTRCTAG